MYSSTPYQPSNQIMQQLAQIAQIRRQQGGDGAAPVNVTMPEMPPLTVGLTNGTSPGQGKYIQSSPDLTSDTKQAQASTNAMQQLNSPTQDYRPIQSQMLPNITPGLDQTQSFAGIPGYQAGNFYNSQMQNPQSNTWLSQLYKYVTG